MLVTIKSVTVENIVKGKARYSVAKVGYEYKGEPRNQNIMSFVNPGVFKQVSEWENNLPTDEVDITLTKNAQGYSEWAAVSQNANSPASAPSAPSATVNKVVGSNYETREERAHRQVLIVRQSCLAQSVAYFKDVADGDDVPPTLDKILETAQEFEKWVFRTE